MKDSLSSMKTSSRNTKAKAVFAVHAVQWFSIGVIRFLKKAEIVMDARTCVLFIQAVKAQ